MKVLDACLSKGSKDNMTVILLCFEVAPQIDPEAVKKEEEWKMKIVSRVVGNLILHFIRIFGIKHLHIFYREEKMVLYNCEFIFFHCSNIRRKW